MRWLGHVTHLRVADVVDALGLTVRKRMVGPCPACGAEQRGSQDARPPIGTTPNGRGWECNRCHVEGSALDLVCLVLYSTRLEKGDARWEDLRAWYEEKGFLSAAHVVARASAPPPPPRRPPQDEVSSLWRASLPPHELPAEPLGASSRAVRDFLARRAWDLPALAAAGVARLLPDPRAFDYPAWWPVSWAATWRLVTGAYTSAGDIASVHARATAPLDSAAPKTRWPKGYEARELLFADRRGLALLRGEAFPHPDKIEGVIVVEGLTDLCATAATVETYELPLAVLAGTSGSWGALKQARLPVDTTVFVATDPDETGDKYALEIGRAVWPRRVRRLPLDQLHTPAQQAAHG